MSEKNNKPTKEEIRSLANQLLKIATSKNPDLEGDFKDFFGLVVKYRTELLKNLYKEDYPEMSDAEIEHEVSRRKFKSFDSYVFITMAHLARGIDDQVVKEETFPGYESEDLWKLSNVFGHLIFRRNYERVLRKWKKEVKVERS